MNDRTKPNILWICTDQQRWDTLGATGNRLVETPNIDRLYAEGAAVPYAYCQSPVCTPSRASFLTGRYPRTTRTRQNGQDIPADEVLISRILADNGYACGLSGKLHLSACHPSVTPVTERRIDDGYAAFYWSHHPARAVLEGRDAKGNLTEANWPLNAYNLWLAQKGARYAPAPFEGSAHVQVGPAEEDHHTTWCAEMAIEFMEAHRRGGQPWMFSVNMFDPHHPFDPPRDYLERYLERLDEIELPNYVPGELDKKPVFQQIDHRGAYGGKAGLPFDRMSERDHKLLRAAYYAMCDLIDAQVGRMIAALERTGQRENTIVIFMSDHGEMLGDHGIYLKGPFFYEPAIRVPLVLNCPGLIPAQTVDGLVELVDVAPTLLDAAGVPRYVGMQGRSLWEGIAAGQGHSTRPDVCCEYYNAMPWHYDPHTPQFTMVRTATHKLVASHGDRLGELYDLAADPNETRNLWDEPAAAAAKIEMLQRLCDRMAFTVDPLPLRRAAW
jgi:arylsulfatase A-like enzyme